MDRERRAGRRRASPAPRPSASARPCRGARQDHGLARPRGSVSSVLSSGRGGREGRHARRHVVGNAERVEPAHLLGDRAIDRGIAGMDARHVLAVRACAASICATISSEVSGAVSTTTRTLRRTARPPPAAPANRHRAAPAQRSISLRPRTVMRSGSPGPAPMKCTVMRLGVRLRWHSRAAYRPRRRRRAARSRRVWLLPTMHDGAACRRDRARARRASTTRTASPARPRLRAITTGVVGGARSAAGCSRAPDELSRAGAAETGL